jgi:hypothetical protein
MPISDILAALIEERDRLNRAVEVLSPNGSGETATHVSRRGHMSASARKRQSERMRAYWAAKRRKGGATGKKKS